MIRPGESHQVGLKIHLLFTWFELHLSVITRFGRHSRHLSWIPILQPIHTLIIILEKEHSTVITFVCLHNQRLSCRCFFRLPLSPEVVLGSSACCIGDIRSHDSMLFHGETFNFFRLLIVSFYVVSSFFFLRRSRKTFPMMLLIPDMSFCRTAEGSRKTWFLSRGYIPVFSKPTFKFSSLFQWQSSTSSGAMETRTRTRTPAPCDTLPKQEHSASGFSLAGSTPRLVAEVDVG